MAAIIDSLYFAELQAKEPVEVCKRALCSYDPGGKLYRCGVWGRELEVIPDTREIWEKPGSKEGLHEYFKLFLILYLLRSTESELSQEWVSEKDLQGGAAFFRGPHELPTHLVCNRFGDDVALFREGCEKAGGVKLDMADAAYSFQITPRIPVALLYWAGDEDFPAESKLLFDATIEAQIPLDIIYALAVGVCEQLGSSE